MLRAIPDQQPAAAGPLAGGGDMGALMRAFDWSKTGLGRPETWPPALAASVSTCLNCSFPILLWWGPDLVMIYNDEYRPLLGASKHPRALGCPGAEVWPELWDDIGPMLRDVIETGEATRSRDLLLTPHRNGCPLETYFSFSFSPIACAEAGGVGGVFMPVMETTGAVIAKRRLRILRDLAAAIASPTSVEEMCRAAAAVVGAHPRDVPFAIFYAIGEDGAATLAAAAGIAPDPPGLGPGSAAEAAGWPLARVVADKRPLVLDDLSQRFGALPGGEWSVPPRAAMLLPIAAGAGRPAVVVAAAISPHRPFDDDYRGFFDLLAGQLAQGLAKVGASEQEAALRDAELSAAIAIAAARTGVWDFHPRTRVLAFDERSKALFGLPPEAAMDYQAWLRAFHADDRQGMHDAVMAATDPAGPGEIEGTFRIVGIEDGVERWLAVSGRSLVEDGRCTRVIGVVWDVTEERRASAAIEESETQFRSLAESIPQLAWMADSKGWIFWYNERWYDYTGTTLEEMEGWGWRKVHHPEHVERVVERLSAHWQTGEPWEDTFPLRAKDGVYRWFLSRARPIHDAAGRIVRWFGTNTDVSEQLEIEQRLREREAELARVQRVGGVGGVDVDLRDGFHNRRSPEYLRLHGLTEEDVNESHEAWVARLHPEDRQRAERHFLDALAQGAGDYAGEYRIVRPSDGQVRWISARGEIERDAQGRPLRLVGAHIDVTELKLAEAALRESEERFRTMADSAPALIWMTDADGEVVFRNQRYAAMFGPILDDTDDAGNWKKLVHPDDADAFYATFRAAFDARRPFHAEVRVVDRSGGLRWLRCEGTPRMRNDGGAFHGYVGCNVDITEAKLTNEALERRVEEQAQERKRIFELSQDLFAVGNFDGFLTTINPAWTRVLGYDEASLLSRPFAEIIHPDDLAVAAEVLDTLTRGEVTQRFEYRLRRTDGSYLWFSWTAVPQGDVFYAVGRDITQEKAVVDELADANGELRRQIAERQRVEATLSQMQRLEVVGQLTAGVAHDFNNLLTVVLGNIGFLERMVEEGSPAARRLANTRMAAERGARLTGQLLAFSRRQRLEPKAVDLNEIVAGMSDLMRSTLGGSVGIETALKADLWPALVDPTQIELVILNLAINGRDAMLVGGSLRVATDNVSHDSEPRRPGEPRPGDYVVVSVADTGTGMSDEVLAKAFEPFFTTKEVGKGSGLGLAQVFGFAEQSRGGVAIETQPGRGTTVRVYLPRAAANANDALDRKPLAAATPRRKKATILVVDDDAAVREVTATTVREFGYRVVEAASGAAALDVLARKPAVALVLLDFAMPGMNGAEVARRSRARRPDIPILFVTGYADTGELTAAGEQNLIQKPYRADELAARIELLLAGDGEIAAATPA